MKKYEILFDWPISEISRLADSDEAEAFAEGLNEPEVTAFSSLAEEMRSLGTGLETAKNDLAHFGDWSQLLQCVNAYQNQFPTFPNAAFQKFKLFIILAAKLSATNATLDNDDIDDGLFELRHLIKPLPQHWFARENSAQFENSLVVFSCDDLVGLEHEFDAEADLISPKLVFHTLAAIAPVQELSGSHFVLVKRTGNPLSDKAVLAYVNLAVLASGKPIHVPRRYSSLPQIINVNSINPENNYHQWNEVLDVLSEYNSRDEVLLKFLTLYHVFENLMFKRPIVQLERQQNGRMFSIRDFKRLYDQVNMSETTALGKLFSSVFSFAVVGTTTIEQRVVHKWKALATTVAVTDIETALKDMKINKKFGDFKVKQAAGYFTEIVYALRCAIVHNKETEFHLTYASLTAGFTALIESFLLPCLEELCFAVLCSQNTDVWYQNEEIKLY